MKFGLIDRITELTRGERIVAVKAVSLAEEYLADHFPTFPVLPGVLMLQAMAEAASWLVRDAHDFREAVVLLRNVRNATYKSFVKPGSLVVFSVTCRRLSADTSDFEGVGCRSEDQQEVVRAKFGLTHLAVAGGDGSIDDELVGTARAQFAILRS